MMPRLSGIDALKKLRADGCEIPVLMISAHLDAQQPEPMEAIGANGVIPKPFEWDVLIERIEALRSYSTWPCSPPPWGRLIVLTPPSSEAVLIRARWVKAWGKLPINLPCLGLVLLGDQADVVDQAQQPLEQLASLVGAPRHRQGVREPERAREERALLAMQPVDVIRALAGRVAPHEPVRGELGLDRVDRADHARVVGRQEADGGNQQRRRVEVL